MKNSSKWMCFITIVFLAVLAFSPMSAQRGVAMGGQQPIAGSKIYLYAAGTGGYNTAPTSLLHGSNVTLDSAGKGYVLSDAGGNFSITGDYSCPLPGSQVYLLVLGGNSGYGGNNAALALMSALGSCSALTVASSVSINELTTVAAAWALAPFGSASTTSFSTTSQNVQGLTNAFATSNILVNAYNGQVSTTINGGSSTVPADLINTLANLLASCVNSAGGAPCTSLFSLTTPSGGGATPTNTIQAALNMAKYPAKNVSSLYNLTASVPSSQIFLPVLTSAPHDWTVSIQHAGGGIQGPTSIAIDVNSNIWVANLAGNSISSLSNTGAPLSPSTGFLGGGLSRPGQIAVDLTGNIWVANCGGRCIGSSISGNIAEFNSAGTAISPSDGYSLGRQNYSSGIAVDASNNIWISNDFSNTISKLSNSGTLLSVAADFTTPTMSGPYTIAMDSSGYFWIPNRIGNSVTRLNSGGAEMGGGPSRGSGLTVPTAVAVDAGSNIWVANSGPGGALTELRKTGLPASPSTYTGAGITSPTAVAVDGAGSIWTANSNNTISAISGAEDNLSPSTGYKSVFFNHLSGIALDSSGNVWVTSCGTVCPTLGSGAVVEMVGLGFPVVTPLVKAITTNPTPSGASAICKDWTYSFSQTRSGTCSSHGGVLEWLSL